jgi:ABC-type anion transport system duplicated permease subunit
MARFRGPSRPFALKAAILAGLLGSTFLLGGCSNAAEGAWLGAWIGALIGGDAQSAGIGAAVGAGVGAVIDAETASASCPHCGHVHYQY